MSRPAYNGFDLRLESSQSAIQIKNYDAFRTIYVLLGGTGMKIGLRLRKRILEAYGFARLPFQEFIWLDTDGRDQSTQTIEDSKAMEDRIKFGPDDLVDLRLSYERVSQFRDNPQQGEWLWRWLDPEFLKELGRHATALDGAAQIRSLGRLAFENHFDQFQTRFQQKGGRIRGPQIDSEARNLGFNLDQQGLEVVIISSLAGGTGSGCFIQVGRSIAELTRNWGLSVNLTGYFLLPEIFDERLQGTMYEEVKANAFAALSELNALTARTQGDPDPFQIGSYRSENPKTNPFNQIYLIDGQNDQSMTFGTPKDHDAFDMVADALFLDFERSEFGTRKRSHRCNMSPHLSNFEILSTPVEDGGGTQRHYAFRFPTAFGALGVARVPFDRRRFQRAAAARLAFDMLSILISDPNKKLQGREIDDLIVKKKIDEFGLSQEGLIDEMVRGGAGIGSQPLYQPHIDEVEAFFTSKRKLVQQYFDPDGLSKKDQLERLRKADHYTRALIEEILAHFKQIQDKINPLLSQDGVRRNQGKDGITIIETSDEVISRSKDKIKGLIVDLLADPLQYGLDLADRTLEKLSDLFNAAPHLPQIDEPYAPSIQITTNQEIERALDLREAADGLWLPGYAGIARRFCDRHHSRLLSDAGDNLTKKIRIDLLDIAEKSIKSWIQARYRRAAAERCGHLLTELSGYVGKRVEVSNDRGETTVQTQGLRQELNLYRETLDITKHWFKGLEESYRKTFVSGRNARDRTAWDELPQQLDAFLQGDQVGRQSIKETLLDQWSNFLVQERFLAAGAGDIANQGIRKVLEWAVQRQRDSSKWLNLRDRLELWAVRRLSYSAAADSAFAGQDDALSLISGTAADQQAALDQAGRGANPWLRFSAAVGRPAGLQPLAIVGVQSKTAAAVVDWCQAQTGALSRIDPLTSEGGSAVVYAEKMAFPLYSVAALDSLKSAYDIVKKRGHFDVSKRHTERSFLELPHVLPPANPSVAQRWFELDRLALEAAVLGVFTADPRRSEVSYVIIDMNTGRHQTAILPNALEAIANRFRDDHVLADAVRKEVFTRRAAIFSRPLEARKCLILAMWMQNRAFPQPTDGRQFLEHDLAASLVSLWSNNMSQHLNEPRENLIKECSDIEYRTPDKMKEWTTIAHIRSRQMQPELKLLMVKDSIIPKEEQQNASFGGDIWS
ncbi:tubulin-like doman-containing protein [Myxococcota bacterium]|nr:tubulin-like doman-containing protein [Myxococcota bacterium]MBU1900245.1 tubulin-like doman-containing protein [Myxococcota bacterium]